MHATRRATPADAPTIRAVYEAAAADARLAVPSDGSGAAWRALLESETQLVCCSPGGEILGFVSVFEPESFIHHLFVAPPCQRQGVGSALLAALEPWLPPPWQLKCLVANERALAFYRARGWLEVHLAQGPQGPYWLLRRDSPWR